MALASTRPPSSSGSFPLGESDRAGRRSSRASSARCAAWPRRRGGLRSRFGGALELFTLGELVFFDTGPQRPRPHRPLRRRRTRSRRVREKLDTLGEAAWIVEVVGAADRRARPPAGPVRAAGPGAARAGGDAPAGPDRRLLRRPLPGRARPPAAARPLRGVRPGLPVSPAAGSPRAAWSARAAAAGDRRRAGVAGRRGGLRAAARACDGRTRWPPRSAGPAPELRAVLDSPPVTTHRPAHAQRDASSASCTGCETTSGERP